jgi:lipoprotein-anchoring transpeptidase ErfK/SrfK
MTPGRIGAPLPFATVAGRFPSGSSVAALGLAALLLAGCSGGTKETGQAAAAAAELPGSTLPVGTQATTSTTVAATSTTAAAAAAAVPEANLPPDTTVAGTATLARGSKGPAVQAVEQRLTDLRFDPGKADGSWDAATDQAILSFQKQAALPRTGKADAATRARLAGAPFGVPMVTAGAEPNRVEVDLERQVLQIWKDNKLFRVIGVSSGNGRKYCDTSVKTGKKVCGVAVTPTGMFHFERKIKGERKSDLGTLFDPVYFTGGYAVHGSPSVPATPASHGCVRIPIRLSTWFYDNTPVGTQIFVLKGGTPALPASTPVDTPPTTLPPTTTTLVPPPTTSTLPKPSTTTTRPVTTTAPSTTTSTTAPASTTTTPTTTHLVP